MRCTLLICSRHHGAEPCDVLHQRLLRLAAGRCNGELLRLPAACRPVFGQDGFDADNGIQDVRPRIPLKGGELLRIENIILGGLVGKIAVFDGCQRHLPCGILRFLSRNFRIARNLLEHALVNILNQRLQAHDAAVSCLEGLSVLAVDRAESDVTQLCSLIAEGAFPCRAEHLHEVKCLPLVGDVDDLIRVEAVPAVQNRGQIRCGIQRRAVALENHAGRNLLRIRGLRNIHHQCTLALVGRAGLFHVLHHRRNQIVHRRLAVPEVEGHIQIRIIALHIGNRHPHDVLPQRAVPAVPLLQPVRVLQRLRMVRLILFGKGARIGINLLQIAHRKGRLFRILSFVSRVKIRKLRVSFPQLRDDKPHLQSPVAQMNVADGLVAMIAHHSLYGFADDRGAKMSHVQRLGYIGSAVVQNNGLRLFGLRHAELLLPCHPAEEITEEIILHVDIEKSRLYNRCIRKNRRVRKLFGHLPGDCKGRLMILLRPCHGTAALILRKIRTGGNHNLSHGRIVARCGKCPSHLFRQHIQ